MAAKLRSFQLHLQLNSCLLFLYVGNPQVQGATAPNLWSQLRGHVPPPREILDFPWKTVLGYGFQHIQWHIRTHDKVSKMLKITAYGKIRFFTALFHENTALCHFSFFPNFIKIYQKTAKMLKITAYGKIRFFTALFHENTALCHFSFFQIS